MIEKITLENYKLWRKKVEEINVHDIYYLPDYVKAFQIHGDGTPCLIYVNLDTNKAINVVMQRDISEDQHFKDYIAPNQYYDFTTPYGYGGFLFEAPPSEKELNCLKQEYEHFCIENQIICEFNRYHPVLNNSTFLTSIYDVVNLGPTVTISLCSQDLIWSNMTSQNRNKIRKAIKEGITIGHGDDWELYEKFMDIYHTTMEHDHADSYYYFSYDFFKSIHNDLKNNATVFYATHQEKIVAMSIIMFQGSQLHYHLSASLIDYRKYAPTNLLLYEAAVWGCNQGYKTFHLGGGLGSIKDSLYKFKKSFNKGNDTLFSIGTKIFLKEQYDTLNDIRSQNNNFDNETRFFPLYRA